jgi:hypothetical protein
MAAKKRKKTSGGKTAKPARAKKPAAKRASKKSGRAAARTNEDNLVYSDIRRSIHGAILRSLR